MNRPSIFGAGIAMAAAAAALAGAASTIDIIPMQPERYGGPKYKRINQPKPGKKRPYKGSRAAKKATRRG